MTPAPSPARPVALHRWDVTTAEARRIQAELAPHLTLRGGPRRVRLAAGVDVAAGRTGRMGRAAVVVLSYPDLALIEQHVEEAPLPMPYIPGLLFFREAPLVLAAWERLSVRPDLLFVDGQGIAHPRRFGLACHLGLWLGLPAIGCAKSRLVGQYEMPGEAPGDETPLFEGDERLGSVVRTRAGARPLFVSPGHRIGFAAAVRWTLALGRGYRLPEPTRLADLASKHRRPGGAGPGAGDGEQQSSVSRRSGRGGTTECATCWGN